MVIKMENDIFCKNCGKQIKQDYFGNWYHIDNLNYICYPDTFAEPLKECNAEILVNNIKYKCELEYGHNDRHYCKVYKNYIVRW